jgi:hypothetical protein
LDGEALSSFESAIGLGSNMASEADLRSSGRPGKAHRPAMPRNLRNSIGVDPEDELGRLCMSVRLQIAAMVFMMVQAVLFGAGMVAILLTSAQSDAMTAMPTMIAVSCVASAAIAWLIAPRLRQRYWRAKGCDGDLISG